jgi:hypothetical protein
VFRQQLPGSGIEHVGRDVDIVGNPLIADRELDALGTVEGISYDAADLAVDILPGRQAPRRDAIRRSDGRNRSCAGA